MTLNGAATPEATPRPETSEVLLRKLLVAIDFSQQTPHTLETALAIGRLFGSELLLVNAATPMVYGMGNGPVPMETAEMNLDVPRARMTELVKSCHGLKTIKHREIVTFCNPADLIEQIVKEEKVDLVIAGSHGASGVMRLALGSIAQSILERVPCPTLVVGPQCTAITHPFRSILLATDLELTGLRAAQYASGLSERFHGKLTLLHVVEPKAMHEERRPAFCETETLRALRRLVPSDLAIYSSGEVRIEYGKAAEMITHIARSVCPSLIVMGVREGAILSDHAPWSTLAQVIREAHCPVLVVRRTLK